MVPARSAVALGSAVVIAVLAVGCSPDDDEPQDRPTPSPATTSPPADAGSFFTWEQDRTLDGDAAAAVRTVQGRAYFDDLGLRYGGYTDPAGPALESPRLQESTTDSTPSRVIFRGPTRYRLTDVTVDGDTAQVRSCRDVASMEKRRFDSDDWGPAVSGTTVLRYSWALARSDQSPTGWVVTGPATTGIPTTEQCAAALASPAGVELTGPPDLQP